MSERRYMHIVALQREALGYAEAAIELVSLIEQVCPQQVMSLKRKNKPYCKCRKILVFR